jgi:drug/metabolite transporter (DMT)-like permease
LSAPPASASRTVLLTLLALVAFAGNSLLARLALTQTRIEPATFTAIRILSGAAVLALLVFRQRDASMRAGSWASAAALFLYAAAFSFAYVALSAGTGALLLFGAVQATMITAGLLRGERLRAVQLVGLLLAYGGLVGLTLPGVQAPPLVYALLMIAAGVAWGVYSLRGRGVVNPTAVTAGNFLRAVPLAVVLSMVLFQSIRLDATGVWYAIVSGAVTSGVGYVIWYTALRSLRATTAATVQLSVPVLAAVGGVLLLHEPITSRLIVTGCAILGGVALVVLTPARRPAAPAQVGE